MRLSFARLTLGFSLLLLLVTAAVWARSYREVQTLYFGRGASGISQVGCARGRFFWVWCASTRGMNDRRPAARAVAYTPETWEQYEAFVARCSISQWHALGFGHDRGTTNPAPYTSADPARPYRRAWVPAWALLLPAALSAARWGVRALRRRRWVKSGQCPGCGYDLRASTHRCPECGKPTLDAAATGNVRAGASNTKRRRRRLLVPAAVTIAAAVYVAWPLTSARHAARFVGHWEVLNAGLPPDDRAYLRFRPTWEPSVRLVELTVVGRDRRIEDVEPWVWGDPQNLRVDGNLLFRAGDDPIRFWFEGPVLVVDSVTEPDVAPKRYAPVPSRNSPRLTPSPPGNTRTPRTSSPSASPR
jgi:hypothetical protein